MYLNKYIKRLKDYKYKSFKNKMRALIFGSEGWIGSQICNLLSSDSEITCFKSKFRLEDRQSIEKELDDIKPDLVFNCAGKTGRPNVDWCESHRQEVIRSNVIGTTSLIDLCFLRNIHVTNFATGCIYEYDASHPEGSGLGFTEEDPPNFMGSFYSRTKALAEALIKEYPNVLTLRLRMPLTDNLNPRNFITKIISYPKVVNIKNSMSILDDLLPISIKMAKNRTVGVYNFTNPGVISHNEILSLYRIYIDKNFTWNNFSLEEQSQILKAGRSNNQLNVDKLLSLGFEVPEIKESMVRLFERMAKHMKVEDAI